jgi:capsule polysaccharide export protein KpsE/RkpR
MKTNLFDYSEFWIFIRRNIPLLAINFVLIVAVAIYYSFFFVKKEYVSSLSFLAPQESSSISNLLQIGGMNNYNSNDIMPQQIEPIFSSKTLKRKIIDRFNLISRYKLTKSPNSFELAVKRLNKDMVLEINEMGSLGMSTPISFKISCYHTSADTSYQMVKYSFELLDSTIRHLSVSSARRNREFIESQLALNSRILDSIKEEYGKYKIENKLYDIQAQLQMSLSSYGQIKTKILTNEVEIKSLMQNMTEKAPQIRALKNENAILKRELQKIEQTENPDIFLGFEKSVKLNPEVNRFEKEIMVQERLLLMLSEQLEDAKIAEAKNLSVLRLIDFPYVPEYKIRPRRAILTGSIVAAYMTLLTLLLLIVYIFKTFRQSDGIYENRKQLEQ